MNAQNINVPALRFPEFNDDWKEKKLGEISKIERGKFTPRPRNDPKYYFGNIPFVQTSDVTNSKGRISVYSQTLNDLGLAVSKLFPKGTILITIAANIGYSGILEIDMACPDSLIGISCKEYISNEFLNFYLSTQQKTMDKLAPEGSQKNINIEFLQHYPVPVTSFPEQRKIAAFLTAIDEKIRQLAEKKHLLERYKKGVMQQIFNQEIRFKDDNGNDFPDWEEKKLGQAASIVKRKLPDSQNVPVMTISAGKGFLSQEERFSKVIAGTSLKNYTCLEFGELAYNRGNSKTAKYGCISMMRKDLALVPYVYHCFRLTDKYSPKYFEYFASTSLLDKQLKNIISSSARGDGLLNVSQENFLSIRIKFPSLSEQQKIADFLSAIDAKINLVNQQLEKTQTYKKGLLQQMFV